jgi:putative DNA primase/helicase
VLESRIIDELWLFLDRAKVKNAYSDLVDFRPRAREVEEVLKALKSAISLNIKHSPPCWIDCDEAAPDLLVFNNHLVNSANGEMSELTPRLWVTSAVEFDYDPEARCPRWEQFLEEIFPDDPEAQSCIEEQLGYGMTNETKFEKGALWIGERRSGKSTLTWIQEQLVGAGAYVSLSFQTWTKTENSRAGLIGKKVAVFPDTRLKPSRVFGRSGFDAGGLDHQSAELLLNIIGRDRISIGQKYKENWEGQPTAKIIITSNVAPNLQDEGRVLESRFIKLEFKQSFYGREDIDLRSKLVAELPGIANRCLTAYRRLCERGGFIQPKSGLALARQIETATNPYAAYMQDCWIRDDNAKGPPIQWFLDVFKQWCEDNGRFDLRRTNSQMLIKHIRAMPEWGWITVYRPHNDPRRYAGLRQRQLNDDPIENEG